MSIPVAILGPTGYTGLELLELLAHHSGMHAAYLASARPEPFSILREFPRLANRLNPRTPELCKPIDHDAIASACRLAFLCLPHEAAMIHAPHLLARNIKVVDLSAAFRLKDPAIYHAAYAHHHTDPTNLAHAVYGLPELFRHLIPAATLVANPGCYPTASALALAPFLRDALVKPDSIIINAASGASGAGREAKPHLTIVEAGDNFSAYAHASHRHQPEIEQTLAAASHQASTNNTAAPSILFLPHLLPIERGILATITAELTDPTTTTAIAQHALKSAYAHEPFITIRDDTPTLRDVQKTNSVHINARVINPTFARSSTSAPARPRLVVVAAIDNLVKGASGQAIQNANLMLGLEESAGLQ